MIDERKREGLELTMKKKIWLVLTALCLCLGITAAAAGYLEVPDDAWFADAVEQLRDRGVMIGTSEDSFEPNGIFTRAQTATVLYRLAGEPEVTGTDSFSDTLTGAWYSDAVLWASQSGIIRGYGNGLFGTNDPVTEEQLVTLLWRQAGSPSYSGGAEPGVSPWAEEAVRWARETIIYENGYVFEPKASATRALVAVLTERFIELGERKEGKTEMTLTLIIGDTPVSVDWEDNASVDALRELVKDQPLTVEMSMYGGFEQVGSLGTRLPRDDRQTTTESGDIVLYSGNQIVVFYGSNSWAYTRLGHISDKSAEEMKALLGNGNVTLTLEMGE